MNCLLRLQRLVPLLGLFLNRIRYPRLWTGLNVEIVSKGDILARGRASLGAGTRVELLAGSRLELGDGVATGRDLYMRVDEDQVQVVGDGTSLQDNCRIYGNVRIGKGCIFGPNVYLSSGDHLFDVHPALPILEQERLAAAVDRPITVFDDCWFGINVFVRAGVTIGRGSVIGANAVVTSDVPPYSIAAGAPAKVIRQRFAFAPPAAISGERLADAPYFYDGFALAKADGAQDREAEGGFILALHKPGATKLRLRLDVEAVEIGFAGQTQRAAGKDAVCVFSLPAEVGQLLAFSASARCRVIEAELA